MKRWTVFLLAFALIMALAACGVKNETASTPTEVTAATTAPTEAPAQHFATIEAKNCYNDAGYIEFISGAETAAEYTFTAENSESVKWRVYVLDEAFDDALRYIAQITEPVLIGDGTVSVSAGQYVYVNCSANEFTTGVVDENAKLHVTVK